MGVSSPWGIGGCYGKYHLCICEVKRKSSRKEVARFWIRGARQDRPKYSLEWLQEFEALTSPGSETRKKAVEDSPHRGRGLQRISRCFARMELNRVKTGAGRWNCGVFQWLCRLRGCAREWDANDGEGIAGEGAAGPGAATAAVPEGKERPAAAGGVVAGDAAGGGGSGGADCGRDGFFDQDGFSNGTVGTEKNHQPASVGKDGAGAGMRCGVWSGAVAPFAGGSGDGACGTGVVEEAVYYEEDGDAKTGD